MKTLADIRQRMQPGARVEVTKHTKYPNQVGSVRTVLKCQSKSIKWDVGYSDWPSRKQVRFIDNDTYEYDLHDEKGEVYSTIGLRFLPEVQS